MLSKKAFKSLVKQCLAEVIVESDPPHEKWNDTFGNKMPGEFTVESQDVNESLSLTFTGREDDWGRPIYIDQSGNNYVDINLGNGVPSIHSITPEGEPESPIKNYTIAQEPVGGENKFKNALCPRCKNSKPELMTNYSDGTKTCNSCHWSNNNSLTEMKNIVKECVLEVLKENLSEGFDPQSNAGPNTQSTEGTSEYNPYPAWNSKMRKLEEDGNVEISSDGLPICPTCNIELNVDSAGDRDTETMGGYDVEYFFCGRCKGQFEVIDGNIYPS
jgi:hypothetical protein